MAIGEKKLANTELKPGMRVDDFTVAYRITRGMNTDVFAVWHHGLNTPLICKRLRPEGSGDRKWRALLRQEAAVLGQLNRPGIVRLIAYRARRPLPYILLEHVGEKTLRDKLAEEGPCAPDTAARVIQHVGAAVAYAHDRGFLHRDLKPSNIIMRDGRPVLVDFGVVWKWRGRRRPPDRCGTAQYLAPEQIERGSLTPAADVFGLGCLLFELLTAQRPFPRGRAGGESASSLAETYPQIREAPLRLARAGYAGPKRMEALVRRRLECDPRDRFATVPELLAELDQFTRVKIWPRSAARSATQFAPFGTA